MLGCRASSPVLKGKLHKWRQVLLWGLYGWQCSCYGAMWHCNGGTAAGSFMMSLIPPSLFQTYGDTFDSIKCTSTHTRFSMRIYTQKIQPRGWDLVQKLKVEQTLKCQFLLRNLTEDLDIWILLRIHHGFEAKPKVGFSADFCISCALKVAQMSIQWLQHCVRMYIRSFHIYQPKGRGPGWE